MNFSNKHLVFSNMVLNKHLVFQILLSPMNFSSLGSLIQHLIPLNSYSLITTFDAKFVLTDLGPLQYFLGFQIHYLESRFIMNQGKYVKDLLHKLHLTNLKPTLSPSVLDKHLSITDGKPLADPFIYQSSIGALQYLNNTHPDISYIVNQLSQFLHKLTNLHWQVVKRVL